VLTRILLRVFLGSGAPSATGVAASGRARPPTDRVTHLPARLAVRLLLRLLVFVIPIVGIVTFIWQYLWPRFGRRDRLMQRMWPAVSAGIQGPP
jgi:cytochrome b561